MNTLTAKSTAMNCTINIDEELNYIELFKNMLDLAGSQGSQPSPKYLNGMYVSAFAYCVSLIAPESIIQSHCSEKCPIVFLH